MRITLRMLMGCGILAAGCIRMEQTLTLKENGSGSLDLIYSMSEQSITQMKAMLKLKQQMAMASLETDSPIPEDDGMYLFLNPVEEHIRKEFTKYEEYGITLEKVKIDTRNAIRQIQIKILFKDLATMAEADFFPEYGFSLTRNSDGHYVFYRASESSEQATDLRIDDETAKLMAPILSGFNIVIRIRTPGRILESNAHKKSSDVATWTFAFDRDPNALLALQRQNFMVVFDGNELAIPEVRSRRSADFRSEEHDG